MNKISCDICMDLMPLVQDGAASEDSVQAVEDHIRSCPRCRALYQAHPSVQESAPRITAKIKNRLRSFFAFLTFLGMFFGISLMFQEGMLYILFLMPVIGACSYLLYRWQALWKSPLILTVLFLLAYVVTLLQGETFDPLSILLWVLLIAFFTDLGVLIAGLLHFALRKEN